MTRRHAGCATSSRSPSIGSATSGRSARPRSARWVSTNIFDLLTWYPRRYIDRTKRVDLSDLTVGEEAAVFGEITRIKGRRMKNGKVMVEANVSDDSGSFKVVFFNQSWRENQLPVGVQALFFGKVTDYRGERQMTNPVVDVIVGRLG